MTLMTTPIFDHTKQKINELTFSFPEFVTACKNLVHPINSFLRCNLFQSHVSRMATPILNYAQSKIFKSTFNLMNLYQHAKNQAISSFCSRETVDLRILQSD